MLVLIVGLLAIHVTQISFVSSFNAENHPNWHLLDHEHCGDSQSDRIIGGTVAELGQYPWMARLGYSSDSFSGRNSPSFRCGGSLINARYVVTASHCVVTPSKLAVVRIGEHDANSPIDCDGEICAPPVQDFAPEQITAHAGYSKPDMWHDIALIRLDRPVNINPFASPICVPRAPLRLGAAASAELAGWGITDPVSGVQTPILRRVSVPLLNQSRCSAVFALRPGPAQLCAGGQPGYDSCGGDSGGPLMAPAAPSLGAPPHYFLLGVVSYGSSNCGSKAPAVYTDVGAHIGWVLNNMRP